MVKHKSVKLLSAFLAIVLIIGMLPVSALADVLSRSGDTTKYEDILSSLTALESYANAYALEHEEDAVALVINYIRTGVEKYTSGTWTTFCGPEKTAFTAYVAEQDQANSTKAGSLRSLENFYLPNGDEVDFAHMFGAMDMAYNTKNQATADLGSWAGDLADLVQRTHVMGVTGTVEEMALEIRTSGKYFKKDYDDPDVHSFGEVDLLGDLDAYYILQKLNAGSTSICTIMKNYFTKNLTEAMRVKFFVENRLDGADTKTALRQAVYNIYMNNEGLLTLEGTYLPEGVNGELRKACCYAFADYLYTTIEEAYSNTYYNVVDTKDYQLAPGVSQQIKTAQTADGKQIVYYMATADITRGDVDVVANYKDNDASSWGMQRVTEQMQALENKHNDPDKAGYIPNYSVVAGVNADFYNMTTGCPSGALVMEGVEYHGAGSENFFAILKDGSAVIGTAKEYSSYKGNIQEAVGGSVLLVKDGKLVVKSSDNYYVDRVSRTCVGITYDGQIVLMVLDGRQEPFSAGGSAIEIAQIMLEAGCVSALCLDGGGSTTMAAKGEGKDTIEVVNKPSDGYERSVSSSLAIVSTAKPSNVFDHAMVSADYDYLTVNTKLPVKAIGVTATGGAIDLPENSTLKVSDEKIGYIEDGAFVATALGDVQVQLVAEDGTVLGSKTLHVVEPTDLKFTKDSINAIYGQATTLPVEASYNGNPVKINEEDVLFVFIKISMQAIGSLEGSEITMTTTEMVFDLDEWEEGGYLSGFEYTPNADGNLRNIAIGAVLINQIDDFDVEFSEEYEKVFEQYMEAGATEEEADGKAQTAAATKMMGIIPNMTAYLYNEDEANFDFNAATGTNGLVSWKNELENAVYKDNLNIYYILNSQEKVEVEYTFALDMSKMPIPEKLQGLLYMLPGGDQEGRTAWEFLLQLAERISPLTFFKITLDVPEGFTADCSQLRLANEYFKLTSAEVKGGQVIITCNFIEQGEPINPATANPLCVLSGLRFTPTGDDAWDEDGYLHFEITGSADYDIYAHFHVLESLAKNEEYQTKYGLYPYNNTANIAGDSGAHFMNTVGDFSEEFGIQKNTKNGWSWEDGSWSYWEAGTQMTGVHYLPSHKDGETGKYWYDLGTNGTCKDKLTGIFEADGKYYYAILGEKVTGWHSIQDENGDDWFHYFDPNTYEMYTGVRTIRTLTYTFNDKGQMVRGAFRTNEYGTKYFVAGESWFRRFVTLEEGTYWLDRNGYVAYGNAFTVTDNVHDVTWYHFDENTGLLTGLCSGFFTYKGELYYCDENGKTFYGLIQTDRGVIFCGTNGKVYTNISCYVADDTGRKNCDLENGKYWCGANGAIVANGFVTIEGDTYYFNQYKHAKGFTKIGNDYYLFNAGNGKMYKDANMYVGNNSYGITAGMHYFDENGKMFVPDMVNGEKKIVSENGKLYFTVDGVKVINALCELNGEYYFAQSNGALVVNGSAYIVTDELDGKGYYGFDAEGKLIRNGFVNAGDGYTYHFVNGKRTKGFAKIGDDYYLFNAGSGKLYKDATMWVGDNSYGITGGMYYFDKNGKMFVPDMVNGEKKIISENGKLYFTVDGVKVINALCELNGEYYFAQYSGALVVNGSAYIETTELDGKGYYGFDAEGKLIRNGFINGGDGYTYHYANGKRTKGFAKIGDDYYLFNAGSGKLYKDASMWVGTNDYGVKAGMYYFDKDGKMYVPDMVKGEKKIISENGKLYFTVDGVKLTNTLCELNGEYYFAQYSGVLVVNGSAYIETTELDGKGYYGFDAQGKLIRNGFVNGSDGYTYHYTDGKRTKGFAKIGDDYYLFNTGNGKMCKNVTMWVGDNAYGITGGMYYFDKDGKMTK